MSNAAAEERPLDLYLARFNAAEEHCFAHHHHGVHDGVGCWRYPSGVQLCTGPTGEGCGALVTCVRENELQRAVILQP